MSVIGKKPFISEILESFSTEQLTNLRNLINNLGKPSLVALYGNDNLISDADKGIKYVVLKMEEISHKQENGILCFKDNSHCGFFSFTSFSPCINSYRIDPITKKYTLIKEYLTTEEFRRILNDEIEGSGVGDNDWVNKMKDKIDYDETNKLVEIGTKAEVDGDLMVNTKIIKDPHGDTVLWNSELESKIKRYRHCIELTASNDTKVRICDDAKSNIVVDSIQDLTSVFENTNLLANGISNNVAVIGINVGSTIATTELIMASGENVKLSTLTSLTFTDKVTAKNPVSN